MKTKNPIQPSRSARPAGKTRKAGAERKKQAGQAGRAAQAEQAAASVSGRQRIARRLARAGIASRREAEKIIAAGRVMVDGRIITSPALNVLPSTRILVDGKLIGEADMPRLWRYHKPAGLITGERDPQGRASVFDNLPDGLPRLLAVGRLDINTEGLLLLTNHGRLKRHLELPANGWLRRYRLRAYGKPDKKRLAAIARGVVIDGVRYRAADIEMQRRQGDNFWMSIALREGKNREVKKLLAYAGLQVNRLIRLSFGPFQLGDMETGAIEEIPRRVLRQQLGDAWAALVADEPPPLKPKSSTRRKTQPRSQSRSRSRSQSRLSRSASLSRASASGKKSAASLKKKPAAASAKTEKTIGSKPERETGKKTARKTAGKVVKKPARKKRGR